MSTLKEIARRAGVSIPTVSRVLSGKHKGTLPAMAKRVEAVRRIAEELQFRPNVTARSLRMQKSFEITTVLYTADELHMGRLAGIEEVIRPTEYHLNCIFDKTVESPASWENVLRELKWRRPAGVIFFGGWLTPNRDTTLAREMLREEIPYIMIDSFEKDIDAVQIDRSQGVYEAVMYLAATGRKKIAFLLITSSSEANLLAPQRQHGYLRAIQQLKREPIFINIESYDPAVCRAAGVQLAKSGDLPDAVQAQSDCVAAAFMTGLYEMGIRVPQQIAVVGFDDRMLATYTSPPLTTVAQPEREAGRIAAEILLQKISGIPAPTSSWSRTIPTRLVVRESA